MNSDFDGLFGRALRSLQHVGGSAAPTGSQYATHSPLNVFQKGAVAVLSGLGALTEYALCPFITMATMPARFFAAVYLKTMRRQHYEHLYLHSHNSTAQVLESTLRHTDKGARVPGQSSEVIQYPSSHPTAIWLLQSGERRPGGGDGRDDGPLGVPADAQPHAGGRDGAPHPGHPPAHHRARTSHLASLEVK